MRAPNVRIAIRGSLPPRMGMIIREKFEIQERFYGHLLNELQVLAVALFIPYTPSLVSETIWCNRNMHGT